MSRRAAAAPRPAWHGLVLLTVIIALVHVLGLGLVPAGREHDTAVPLGGKFSTRTIVLAPPAPAAPPATPVPTPAAPKPRPKPKPKLKPLPVQPLRAPAPEATESPLLTATLRSPTPSPPPSDPTPDTTGVPATATTEVPASAGAAATDAPQTTGTQALKIPGSTRLDFSVSGQQGTTPYQGGYGELNWLQNGTDYDLQLTLKLLFFTLFNQHSVGQIGREGLAPDRFAEKRRNRAEQATHFVRDTSRIVFSNNKPDVPLQPGAQDRLSVLVQLGALLAGDAARYPPGSTITVQTAGTSDSDSWTFNVEGDETLDLPVGTTPTRKLSRSPRREFDDKVELWLAPRLDYLPVRLRVTQAKGDFFDIQLRSVSAAGPN